MGVVSSFSQIKVTFSCQGPSFFQALLMLVTEAKDFLHYGGGGRLDDHICVEWARNFILCRCFIERCLDYGVVHKGQLQAFVRASASLLTALVKHLSGRQ